RVTDRNGSYLAHPRRDRPPSALGGPPDGPATTSSSRRRGALRRRQTAAPMHSHPPRRRRTLVNRRRWSSVFTVAWYADYAAMRGPWFMRGRVRPCLSLLTASAIAVGVLVAAGAPPTSAAPATPQFVQAGAKEVTSGTTNSLAFSSGNTTGNLIVV